MEQVNKASIAFWCVYAILFPKDVAQGCENVRALLARMRKSQGLTQAELAQQLHVTDKAVSRWERGVGLPDINTLEPLADALGLTLADLMHCRDPQEADIAPEVPLEDFFTLLRRQQSIDWRSVRAVLFWLSAALAIWGILACPGRMPSTGVP